MKNEKEKDLKLAQKFADTLFPKSGPHNIIIVIARSEKKTGQYIGITKADGHEVLMTSLHCMEMGKHLLNMVENRGKK